MTTITQLTSPAPSPPSPHQRTEICGPLDVPIFRPTWPDVSWPISDGGHHVRVSHIEPPLVHIDGSIWEYMVDCKAHREDQRRVPGLKSIFMEQSEPLAWPTELARASRASHHLVRGEEIPQKLLQEVNSIWRDCRYPLGRIS